MHGHKLIIKFLIGITLVLATIMVALNLYPSWSQYALTYEEPLLLATLSSISSALLIRSFTHTEKDRILLKVLGINLRLEHINRIAGFVFIGVLCTPVTHKSEIIQMLHNILTGLGMFLVHLELWTYYKNKKVAIIASLIGIIGFLLAFLFGLYSIGLGEILVTLPVIGYILKTNK